MWSKREKDIARRAFKLALEREGQELLSKLKDAANAAKNLEDVWKIHDFLSKRRKDIDQKYDYRYSVMISVFGILVEEGWVGLDELEGLGEDKISKIKMMAGNIHGRRNS
jgi:hypothetical protein